MVALSWVYLRAVESSFNVTTTIIDTMTSLARPARRLFVVCETPISASASLQFWFTSNKDCSMSLDGLIDEPFLPGHVRIIPGYVSDVNREAPDFARNQTCRVSGLGSN